ncbi:MAG: response regulator transcription factor [Desulfobacterota bacterium]|jgi:DNA-binding NarL/FixJ family response regulator|nr:response regulator transcription factor [Thermodesulfobacteriota bacterium]
MIKILVADDHPIVRQGLKQILSEYPDMTVADEAGSGKDVLSKIAKKDYDIVLLDISMPGRNGLDILKELKTKKPKLPVLVLSIYPEDQYAVRVLKLGAAGYLTKESVPEELVAAIRKVARGRKYVSNYLAEKLASDLEINAEKPLHENLSDREYQVMFMIASGKRLKEISEELSLSIKTISTYRSRIMDKMKMKNNAELIRYALQNSLV